MTQKHGCAVGQGGLSPCAALPCAPPRPATAQLSEWCSLTRCLVAPIAPESEDSCSKPRWCSWSHSSMACCTASASSTGISRWVDADSGPASLTENNQAERAILNCSVSKDQNHQLPQPVASPPVVGYVSISQYLSLLI